MSRDRARRDWVAAWLGQAGFELAPASEDASFRRYFRVRSGDESWILMDAPPDREPLGPFLRVTDLLRATGVNVPEVLARDEAQGFLLLTDFGSTLYLDVLDEDNADRLYGDALGALAAIQACGPRGDELPPYDRELLLAEMDLFRDWLLGTHLRLALSPAEERLLQACFALLADAALEQPRVCVHRDYHSRNLMLTGRHDPGIIDYQDAVIGPVTYDLVSLLRDCYIAWPRSRVEDWALGYHDLALQSGILPEDAADEARFLRWFDWMGVQRHLKAAGIFARLYRRDGKPGYLADIPRTLNYLVEVTAGHPALAPLGTLVQERVLPALAEAARSEA